MATKYENVHIGISEPTTKILKDPKTLRFVGCINGENILEIQHSFAVKVSDAVDDEIVKAVVEEAKKAGIHDVYLMDRNFIINALRRAITRAEEPASYSDENAILRRRIYIVNDLNSTLKIKVKVQEEEISNLKAELAKARGGCQRLRESKEELQECVQTLKKNFDEERDARIKRDKEYSQLFIEYEKLKNNEQHANVCRPCYVSGRKALFHGWFLETNYTAYGLIEFENGNLRKVSPYNIRFMDDKVRRVWEGKE